MAEVKNPEVKKREKIPEQFDAVNPLTSTDEEVTIQVGEKIYPVPNLTLKQYKKVLKVLDKQPMEEDTNELEALEYTKDFFFQLLKTGHPELKKEDMDDMPIFQFGAEYIIKLKMALFKIPLGS